MTESPSIRAHYRLRAPAHDVDRLARFIAYEQTVELPEVLITDPSILANIVGRVDSVAPVTEGVFDVCIAYQTPLASNQLGQLLNLVYGNVSMLQGIRLRALELPDSLLRQFSGPRFGISRLRTMLGVHGRPLLATAIKPRGSSLARLAEIAYEFALGGGDIVKDDQNLVDPDFESFKRRVDACAKAVASANAKSGRNCLYFPHLAAPADQIERYADFVLRSGLKGVLLCPIVLGIDSARMLSEQYGLVFMAHPALTGALTQSSEHGIAHDVLLGTLFRLAGADIGVFPATGGRFDYSRETCQSISRALREPLGALESAFPCPAGGMTFQGLKVLADDYGPDSVFLVGGALHGHASSVLQGTREFSARIAELFPEHQHCDPQTDFVSSCEFNPEQGEGVHTLLGFLPGFNWEHRQIRSYKGSGELAFDGVRRVELIGKNGEQADFDLRYFELAKGGFTSLEKHLHTHVIIVTCGAGLIQVGDESFQAKPMDVIYVPPLEVHQISNSADEPLGFFCVVDHERDRPMRP